MPHVVSNVIVCAKQAMTANVVAVLSAMLLHLCVFALAVVFVLVLGVCLLSIVVSSCGSHQPICCSESDRLQQHLLSMLDGRAGLFSDIAATWPSGLLSWLDAASDRRQWSGQKVVMLMTHHVSSRIVSRALAMFMMSWCGGDHLNAV